MATRDARRGARSVDCRVYRARTPANPAVPRVPRLPAPLAWTAPAGPATLATPAPPHGHAALMATRHVAPPMVHSSMRLIYCKNCPTSILGHPDQEKYIQIVDFDHLFTLNPNPVSVLHVHASNSQQMRPNRSL